MLHGPPHGALHVLALVNNGASITDGNSVTPAQVLLLRRLMAHRGPDRIWGRCLFKMPVVSKNRFLPSRRENSLC